MRLLLNVAAFAAVLTLTAAAAAKDSLRGDATVLDGDTIDIGKVRVRLFGIDAPELAQTCVGGAKGFWPCGREAKERLSALILDREITCTREGIDQYGRILGICSVDGKSINEFLVEEGLAWAFVRYSDAYLATERKARAAARGIFSAENVTAWDYRAHRWSGASVAAADGRLAGCPIKGNISSSGERIYHMPWDRYYAATKIDVRSGERWFCDEGEAERAGWRRAYR